MVICEQLNLLFVEVPNTACTAIRQVLIDHYGGEPIIHKHATYYEFRRAYRNTYKRYFVFGSVRSPLETTLTQYRKLTYDHKDRFTRPEKRQWWSITKRHRQMFSDVQEGMDFADYLRKYHSREYHNFYLVGSQHYDYVIRHEQLQEGFTKVLKKVNALKIIEIPMLNQTAGKVSLDEAFSPEIRNHVVNIFGPFMNQWKYDFPQEWKVGSPSAFCRYRYRTLEIMAEFAGRRIGLSPNGSPAIVQSMRNALRPITG